MRNLGDVVALPFQAHANYGNSLTNNSASSDHSNKSAVETSDGWSIYSIPSCVCGWFLVSICMI